MSICRTGFLIRLCALALFISLCLTLFSACGDEAQSLPDTSLSPGEAGGGAVHLRAIIDPASEVRGVYIASVYNIDFPSRPDLSTTALKAELNDILDTAADAGLNTVYFQVRPTADALYDSDIFPVSETLFTNGKLSFDPLAYLIEQAHKRNIFVHAWVNPLRVTAGSAAKPKTDIASLPAGSPAAAHPEWTVAYADGKLYFDAGYPEVRQLVADGVAEIVRNYNVDGILFDDYFYPYPVSENGVTVGFDDSASYALYGGDMSRGDWRRQNINQMIELVHDTVKGISENVRFGVAPFGIWQNDDGKNGGSATRGLESYSAIYCDPVAWAKGGYIDYLAPQIYWRFSTTVAPYGELVRFWNRMLDGTGVDLVISHAAYNYDEWTEPAGEMSEQVQFARSELTYRGSIFYGYDEIRRNLHTLADELSAVYADSIIYTDPSPTGMGVQISSPAAGTYINAASTYLIGSSSPDKPLTVNGTPVSRTRGGYFSLYVDLQKGENTFVFTQGEESYTYVIFRGTAPADAAEKTVESTDVFALETISPAADMLLESGGSVSVSCKAPAGARVTASLGGTTVALKQTTHPGNADSGWAVATYTGVFSLPRVGADELEDLGEITLTAVLGKNTATAVGGAVRVRGQNTFLPVQVNRDHAELKLGLNTLYYNDFSVQSAGMTDYAVWQGNGFYLLRVGGYMYDETVDELPASTEIPIARLTSAAVTADGNNTYLTFGVDQSVPHNGTVKDGAFELTLYNVDIATVPDEIPVADNPLIRAVEVVYPAKKNCVRFRCELYDTKNFYGFDFTYGDGTAQASLKNPRTIDESADQPLAGIRIVLDAGHGGTDTGAKGPLGGADGIHEADLNLAVTLAAKDKLTALGATVILTREGDDDLSLTERMELLSSLMPDLSVSIHNNSVDYSVDITGIRGTLGLWWADSGVLLTECVADAVADALFRCELEPRQQMLAMCRNPKFPSTLVELGFMTSVEEYEFMLHGGIEKAADGIAEGILAYYRAQAQWTR